MLNKDWWENKMVTESLRLVRYELSAGDQWL